jgi:uncharacterized protein YjbI with pentapeptide repeats
MALNEQEHPDNGEPGTARKEELQQAYLANEQAGRPPYYRVHIRTLGELQWVMRERGWHADIDSNHRDAMAMQGQYMPATDLRDVNLSGANLQGVSLIMADLANSRLRGANLKGAILVDVNFTGARLRSADLSSASLRFANLSGAHCYLINLKGADLSYADLEGARLARADFSGADLTGARFDVASVLSESTFDNSTVLRDVVWNGVPLARVDWGQVRRLGDERPAQAATDRKGRIQNCRNAVRAYNGLASALRAQGLTVPASYFRLREQRLNRRALRLERRYGAWLFSGIIDLVAGYGEQPGRAFVAYLAVVSVFAAVYWSASNFLQADSSRLRWYEAIVLSISSFHGRGFFPSMIGLGDPLAIIAAAEAIIGLFIELIFIATFSRRFLGN